MVSLKFLGFDCAIEVIKLGDYVSIFIYGIFYVVRNNEEIMGIKSATRRRLDRKPMRIKKG
jgi:hypothetical protein